MPLPIDWIPCWAVLALVLDADLFAACAAAYLLGAIPFGLVMAKLIKGVDIRTIGSGNIGATNAMRAMGKPLGLVAFFLDWGKGFAAAAWVSRWAGEADPLAIQVLCGALAVVGHCFPVYLKFRGGKGVATACGAIVAIDPVVFLIGGAVWLGLALTLRYVSVSSMAMGLAFPIAAQWRWSSSGWPFVVGLIALAALILVRHRPNIVRLQQGTEPKMGAKKRSSLS